MIPDRPRYYALLDNLTTIPCDNLIKWTQGFETTMRIVGKTQIGNVEISTVFLGLDHQYGDGPPLIFETMIFGGKYNDYQTRCTTYEQAIAMHEAAVKKVTTSWYGRWIRFITGDHYMKFVIAIILVGFSIAVFANGSPPPPDTLEVITQSADTLYTGHISQYDTEDAIKQVEINNATVVVNHQVTDRIFYNGFELYNINWIWVGDDTNDHEFGGAGDCSAWDHRNSDESFHVVLTCYQIENEASEITD